MVSGSSSWRKHFLHCLLLYFNFVKTFENTDPSNKHFFWKAICLCHKRLLLCSGWQSGRSCKYWCHQVLGCASGFLCGFGASGSGFIFGFIWTLADANLPDVSALRSRMQALMDIELEVFLFFSSKMSLDRRVSRLASQINVFRLIHWYIVSSLARLLVKVIWLWF